MNARPPSTRSSRRAVLSFAAAAVLLAACAGETGGTQTTASSETTETATVTGTDAAGTEAAPDAIRSFEHAFGTTEIPVAPQRIVAADPVTFGILSALDVRPAGATLGAVSGIGHLEPFTEGVADIGGIGTAGELDLEAIAVLDPDLMLTFGVDWNTDIYDSLTPIAPTVGPVYDYVTLEQTTDHWLGVADAAGRLDEGERVVAQLHERMDKMAGRLGSQLADKPVSVLRVGTDGFYSVRFGSLESSLLRAVGIPRPPNQQNPEEFAFDLSLERVDEVDAYAIFVYVDSEADDELSTLQANPLWDRLEAVQAGRVFFVEASVWNGLDPIAADLILDDIDHHLSAALGP